MKQGLNIIFDYLYDPVQFPIEIFNEEGVIVYVNPAFSQKWGYNLTELSEYNMFKDPELKRQGFKNKIDLLYKDETPFTIEMYSDSLLKSRDTALPFLFTKVFLFKEKELKYIVMLHEDRTEMILTEEEIKVARDGNKEAERLKNTFLNVLSHELRTPLNIILGYSSIIKESLIDKINSEDKIYLDNLQHGSERLFNSITQMLEFAQIEAGNYKMSIERAEFINILKSKILDITESAAEKNITIKRKFSIDKIYLDIDVQCIENALRNILENAVKFTNQGFIEVETGVLEDKELFYCKIKDSGVGISSDYLSHLFRPFSQEDLEIGRNFEGNGLGLALSKRYIEKLGGSLLVDSIKGVGSTFMFTIPLPQNGNKPETGENNISKKVLMFDDSLESYELISAFLKSSHEVVLTSVDGSISIESGIDDFSFVIIDVQQNSWNRYLEFVKQIKNNEKFSKPIIILSGENSEERIKSFYIAGADRFIVKPFSKNELLDNINLL